METVWRMEVKPSCAPDSGMPSDFTPGKSLAFIPIRPHKYNPFERSPMSENPAVKPEPSAHTTPVDSIPSYLPEELILLWQWYRTHGRSILNIALIVLIVGTLAGVYWYHTQNQAEKASEQLSVTANISIESLEATVSHYGNTSAGIAAHLLLAKAYYDAGDFDKALTTYDSFLKLHPSHPFVQTAELGRGFAFIGLNRTEEAMQVFHAFQDAHSSHYLIPQVVLGEAACLAMQGKKTEAKALLENLRAAQRDNAWDLAGKRMEGAIDRYSGRLATSQSLFDQANALAPLAGAHPPLQQIKPTSTNVKPAVAR